MHDERDANYGQRCRTVSEPRRFDAHCEMSNEGILWLTKMMGYNEYIPLLIGQMNDAEENLYPKNF